MGEAGRALAPSGQPHLFADESTPHYDEDAARLLRQRVLGSLGGVG
jgi:hypothetical protein